MVTKASTPRRAASRPSSSACRTWARSDSTNTARFKDAQIWRRRRQPLCRVPRGHRQTPDRSRVSDAPLARETRASSDRRWAGSSASSRFSRERTSSVRRRDEPRAVVRRPPDFRLRGARRPSSPGVIYLDIGTAEGRKPSRMRARWRAPDQEGLCPGIDPALRGGSGSAPPGSGVDAAAAGDVLVPAAVLHVRNPRLGASRITVAVRCMSGAFDDQRHRKIFSATPNETSPHAARIASCGTIGLSATEPSIITARRASFNAVSGSAWMNGCIAPGKFARGEEHAREHPHRQHHEVHQSPRRPRSSARGWRRAGRARRTTSAPTRRARASATSEPRIGTPNTSQRERRAARRPRAPETPAAPSMCDSR